MVIAELVYDADKYSRIPKRVFLGIFKDALAAEEAFDDAYFCSRGIDGILYTASGGKLDLRELKAHDLLPGSMVRFE